MNYARETAYIVSLLPALIVKHTREKQETESSRQNMLKTLP